MSTKEVCRRCRGSGQVEYEGNAAVLHECYECDGWGGPKTFQMVVRVWTLELTRHFAPFVVMGLIGWGYWYLIEGQFLP